LDKVDDVESPTMLSNRRQQAELESLKAQVDQLQLIENFKQGKLKHANSMLNRLKMLKCDEQGEMNLDELTPQSIDDTIARMVEDAAAARTIQEVDLVKTQLHLAEKLISILKVEKQSAEDLVAKLTQLLAVPQQAANSSATAPIAAPLLQPESSPPLYEVNSSATAPIAAPLLQPESSPPLYEVKRLPGRDTSAQNDGDESFDIVPEKPPSVLQTPAQAVVVSTGRPVVDILSTSDAI
jgi:hypothetical protein